MSVTETEAVATGIFDAYMADGLSGKGDDGAAVGVGLRTLDRGMSSRSIASQHMGSSLTSALWPIAVIAQAIPSARSRARCLVGSGPISPRPRTYQPEVSSKTVNSVPVIYRSSRNSSSRNLELLELAPSEVTKCLPAFRGHLWLSRDQMVGKGSRHG